MFLFLPCLACASVRDTLILFHFGTFLTWTILGTSGRGCTKSMSGDNFSSISIITTGNKYEKEPLPCGPPPRAKETYPPGVQQCPAVYVRRRRPAYDAPANQPAAAAKTPRSCCWAARRPAKRRATRGHWWARRAGAPVGTAGGAAPLLLGGGGGGVALG